VPGFPKSDLWTLEQGRDLAFVSLPTILYIPPQRSTLVDVTLRNNTVQIRLSDDELAGLKDEARKWNASVSWVVRRRLFESPTIQYLDHIQEVHDAGKRADAERDAGSGSEASAVAPETGTVGAAVAEAVELSGESHLPVQSASRSQDRRFEAMGIPYQPFVDEREAHLEEMRKKMGIKERPSLEDVKKGKVKP
jgi:hypothetical protein